MSECDTVEQALLLACADLQSGAAQPLGIYDEAGALLHGPESIQDRCIALATEQ